MPNTGLALMLQALQIERGSISLSGQATTHHLPIGNEPFICRPVIHAQLEVDDINVIDGWEMDLPIPSQIRSLPLPADIVEDIDLPLHPTNTIPYSLRVVSSVH